MDREIAQLAGDHHVVRYDLRGYGGSTAASSEYSPVRDLVTLLDHVAMTRPLIVGPSVGGKIALDLTLAHPGRVGALLLVAPGYSGMDYDHVPGGRSTFERDERLSKAAADAWSAGNLAEATEHLRQLWASSLEGSALALFQAMVRDNAVEIFEERSGRHEVREGNPAAGRLNEIRVPTRILVGDRDNPAMPHCANFLARGIPGAKVQLVPGADHLLNLSGRRHSTPRCVNSSRMFQALETSGGGILGSRRLEGVPSRSDGPCGEPYGARSSTAAEAPNVRSALPGELACVCPSGREAQWHLWRLLVHLLPPRPRRRQAHGRRVPGP